MEILFITNDLKLAGLANKLVELGHKVTLYTELPVVKEFGAFEKVRNLYDAIKECKYIVADEGSENIYKWAKMFNKPIVGCSPMTDMMNVDCYREYQIAQKFNVPTPETLVVNDVADMYGEVLEWKSVRTLVRYDRQTFACDHQSWLAWAMYKIPLGKKILLQKPTYGEDVIVSGWFDGMKWLEPFFIKSKDESVLRASLMFSMPKKEWIEKVIEPWSHFLKRIEYRGPFSVKAIASKKTVEVISTYAGFEFPSIYAFLEGLREPVDAFLYKVAFSSATGCDITKDYMSSIVVNSGLPNSAGIPIMGVDEGNLKHLYFGAVHHKEDGEKIVVGGPWIYTATAHGRTPEEAFGRAYHTASVVRIPEPKYMTGMASVYVPWLNKLKSLECI